MTLLTLFSSPKPFTNPHIAVIQRNAIRSWVEMGSDVEVVLLGDEAGLAEMAKSLGVRHVPEIKRNSSGTPLISALFDAGRKVNQSPLLAYVNTDILLFSDFIDIAKKTLEQYSRFLLIGQRWDLDVLNELDFSAGWQEHLKLDCTQRGSLHKPTGSDYFIFPRSCFEKIPDFAIGRAGWDNWMIYESRRQGWKTIDTTSAIQVIHQSHDYSHLPGGQPHYRLPETDENIRLAGGRLSIFMLRDANWVYSNGQIKRVKWSGKRFLREMEIFPLVTLQSKFLAVCAFYLFHPKKAYAALRSKLKRKKVEE